MIPWPFWLTNFQFVISAFGVFAFFSAAWLNVDSWAVRREFKTGLRALGFFLLALWSALHGIGAESAWASVTTAAMLLVGVLTIAISHLIDTIPLQPKELVEMKRKKEQASIGGDATLNATTSTAQWSHRRLNILVRGVIAVAIVSLGLIGYGFWPEEKQAPDRQEALPSVSASPQTIPTLSPEPTSETTQATPRILIEKTETDFLNVREGAGTNHDIVATVSPGDTLELLDEDDEWYKVQVSENVVGWVSARYARKQE